MSNRYKGAVISATPPTTTGGESGTASGAWTLEQQMQLRAAGLWPLQPTGPYVEEVFSTYLYTGNGSTQTITNGIDLSGKGGMVWTKARVTAGFGNEVTDTVRGAGKRLITNTTGAQGGAGSSDTTGFTSSGFELTFNNGLGNLTNENYASWTFRKQPKFFDVVTYTGTGSARTVSHNLGSVPACIMVKCTNSAEEWQVYHTSLGNTQYMVLNTTAAAATGGTRWNNTSPTATEFTVGTNSATNGSGLTFVAYLFAHNAGGFGLTGTDNVISCGSFTSSSIGLATVDLGYEPQWILYKGSNGVTNWQLVDNMRGFVVGAANSGTSYLNANTSAAEGTSPPVGITNTGFNFDGAANITYIYIAIRRGPMRTPTLGTSVYLPDAGTNGTTNGIVPVGFRVDMSMTAYRSLGGVGVINDRLRGYGTSGSAGQTPVLQTSSLSGESNWSSSNAYFYNAWNTTITRGSNGANPGGAGIITWFFQRAPSVFDQVCYTGTGAALALTHNLTVAPELIFVKARSGSSYWVLGGNFGASTYWYKNAWGANDSSTSSSYSGGLSFGAQPTATTVTLDANTAVNSSGSTYAMWMWATCPGVSKVGTYTGTGALQTIDCGFTTGARFVLITRVGVTGDNNTYVWDSARGISSSDDPYLLLETSSAEVTNTNYVDTTAVGFKVTAAAPSGLNASGGSYIFLAIA